MKRLIIALITLCLLSACAQRPKGVAAFMDKSAQQIFVAGNEKLSGRRYKEAVEHYEALDALYPFSKFTQKAQLNAIYAYYKTDDLPSALASSDRYIHLYPRSTDVDYAYYMKGLIDMELGKSWIYKVAPLDPSKRDLTSVSEAFVTFNDLVRYFPHSRYACDARKRMLYIRDMLAKHELDVATFYFDREAYLAAANRASQIVQHYEGASEVKPALELMVKSYCAVGKKDLADDARAVLRKNFQRAV